MMPSLAWGGWSLDGDRLGFRRKCRAWSDESAIAQSLRSEHNCDMGAQWKQAGREANAQKRGQMTVKLVREIMVAAKLGGADPDLNARLATAVEKAKKSSVTRDTIERAIKKGAGLTEEKITFEQVTYEGFAPHKVPVVVECLTDN